MPDFQEGLDQMVPQDKMDDQDHEDQRDSRETKDLLDQQEEPQLEEIPKDLDQEVSSLRSKDVLSLDKEVSSTI